MLSQHRDMRTHACMLLTSRLDHATLTISLKVMERRHDNTIRNGLNESWRDLEITCQTHHDNKSRDYTPLYAWRCAYQRPSNVDLARAETMHGMLTKIHAHTENLTDQIGLPTSFAAYAGRIARALAISEVVVEVKAGLTLSDAHYQFLPIHHLASLIETQEYEAKKKWRFTPLAVRA